MAFTYLSVSGENLLAYVLRRDELAECKGNPDGHTPSYQAAVAQIASRELDAAGRGPKSDQFHFSSAEAALLSERLKQLTGQMGTVAGKPAAIVAQVQKYLTVLSHVSPRVSQIAA